MHLFNPWHDLALANFSVNYTPPASAMQMTEELALLPVWYGEGDAVIAEGNENRSYLDTLKEVLPVPTELIAFPEIPLRPHEKLSPGAGIRRFAKNCCLWVLWGNRFQQGRS